MKIINLIIFRSSDGKHSNNENHYSVKKGGEVRICTNFRITFNKILN